MLPKKRGTSLVRAYVREHPREVENIRRDSVCVFLLYMTDDLLSNNTRFKELQPL